MDGLLQRIGTYAAGVVPVFLGVCFVCGDQRRNFHSNGNSTELSDLLFNLRAGSFNTITSSIILVCGVADGIGFCQLDRDCVSRVEPL